MERSEVYKVIDTERDYQEQRWIESEIQDHEIASFILYMEHHLYEARKTASTQSPETEALQHLRKVVALGVKCFEVHGVPERI